jgi:hypothetical protein
MFDIQIKTNNGWKSIIEQIGNYDNYVHTLNNRNIPYRVIDPVKRQIVWRNNCANRR